MSQDTCLVHESSVVLYGGKTRFLKVYLFLANCSCLEAAVILTLGLQHFKRLILCLEDNLYVLQSQQ